MGWILFIFFFLEVLVTIQIGGAIGGMATFLVIVLTALVGLFILKSFKTILGESLVGVMRGTKDMQTLMASNMLTLIGAIFLIIPGFLSDMLGLLMQLGFVTTFLTNRFGITQSKANEYYHSTNNSKTHNQGEDNVIDVEIIEPTSTINK